MCEASLLAKSRPNALGQGVQQESSFYVDYIGRDLSKIVEFVVPEGRIGLPNLMSTKQVRIVFSFDFLLPLTPKDQILEDWRSKRVLDPQTKETANGKPRVLIFDGFGTQRWSGTGAGCSFLCA